MPTGEGFSLLDAGDKSLGNNGGKKGFLTSTTDELGRGLFCKLWYLVVGTADGKESTCWLGI